MSLERLDELLSALPMLKVFKFEVVNKVESSAKTGSASVSGHSRSGSYSGSSLSRGYIQQHQSNLILMKPKRISLEGLEQEVVRVIARRLYRNLERLELSFTASGVVVQSAIEELFAHCGSVLKSLSLTRVEICQVNYNREWSTSIQAEVAALLSSLEAFSLSQSPPSSPGSSRSTVFPPALSSSGTMSTSTSSSSFSSSFSRTSSTSSSASSVSDQPKTTSVLESLSFSSCSVSDRECAIILKQVPALKELYIHDCKNLSRRLIPSILTNTPLLESISINSVPYIHPEGLIELFTVSQQEKSSEIHSAGVATSNNLTSDPSSPGVVGLRLKHVQLSYLRQLDDNVMKVLARHQGSNLVKLSLQWCPHVTDEGIIPILKSCEKLKDISIYLSKPTLNIFQELTDSNTGTKIPWACAQTLERLEVCGQMFLDRIRASNEHLQPQLYHHTSPNPHHIRNGSIGRAAASTMAISGNTSIGTHTSNIIHDPYTVAHDQGYPMYRLLRYNTFSNPFRELQAQMETFPRLTHLGIPSKGVEHLIRKGFGPKVHLRSLALLNQQGRAWSLEEVEDLLRHMPELRILVCEKNTILGPPQPAHNRKEANLYSQHEVLKLLQQKNVELLQPSSSTGSNLCASLK
ncbi:hypothetical protein BGZ46_001745 [Entomortierella lignicola]|nr:hypothetical protein BGZ46_001745 [Entomortierella lignicola]